MCFCLPSSSQITNESNESINPYIKPSLVSIQPLFRLLVTLFYCSWWHGWWYWNVRLDPDCHIMGHGPGNSTLLSMCLLQGKDNCPYWWVYIFISQRWSRNMREQLYLDWVDCCLVDPKDQVNLNQISFHTEKEKKP